MPQLPVQRRADLLRKSHGVTMLIGDVRKTLASLPSNHFHCCVTSPPYWGLRSYLDADHPLKQCELGGESTPEEYINNLVNVFREVRRVLRDDGLCWVNLGDSYNAYNGNRGPSTSISANTEEAMPALPTGRGLTASALKPGDLRNMPHRVAAAMQADGWYWRQTLVWAKPAPMPESLQGTRWERCRVKVANGKRGTEPQRIGANGSKPQSDHNGRDFAAPEYANCPGCPKCEANGGYVLRRGSWRYTTSHEYIFMFAKSHRYFADQEAAKEPCAKSTIKREKYSCIIDNPDEQYAVRHDHESFSGGKRNPRNVWSIESAEDVLAWMRQNAPDALAGIIAKMKAEGTVHTIGTEPLKEAHYAAFPSAIPLRAIAASTSVKGCCPECGAAWARVVEKSSYTPEVVAVGLRNVDESCRDKTRKLNGEDYNKQAPTTTIEFRPTCGHDAEPMPCRVLDPFGGSGTTAIAAVKLGCAVTLCELNQEYVELAERRIKKSCSRDTYRS